jgi:hypothetical protein
MSTTPNLHPDLEASIDAAFERHNPDLVAPDDPLSLDSVVAEKLDEEKSIELLEQLATNASTNLEFVNRWFSDQYNNGTKVSAIILDSMLLEKSRVINDLISTLAKITEHTISKAYVDGLLTLQQVGNDSLEEMKNRGDASLIQDSYVELLRAMSEGRFSEGVAIFRLDTALFQDDESEDVIAKVIAKHIVEYFDIDNPTQYMDVLPSLVDGTKQQEIVRDVARGIMKIELNKILDEENVISFLETEKKVREYIDPTNYEQYARVVDNIMLQKVMTLAKSNLDEAIIILDENIDFISPHIHEAFDLEVFRAALTQHVAGDKEKAIRTVNHYASGEDEADIMRKALG